MTRSAFILAGLLALPATVSAHGLGADAKLADGRVVVEAYYDDDTPAADADVSVVDESWQSIAAGKTDTAGRWSFPAPPSGSYKVVVDAGAGHRAKVTLTVPAVPVESASLSDGPTRAAFTGPQKWLWAAVGLAMIAGGTWLARVMLTSRDRQGTMPTAP